MAKLRSPCRASVGAAGLVLSFALAACGSASSSNGSPAANGAASLTTAAKVRLHGNLKVSISNYAYHPVTVTVATGTRVTFTNQDQTSHTATSTGRGFDTGTVKPGHSARVILTRRGTYTYYCQFHAFMRGTIVVK